MKSIKNHFLSSGETQPNKRKVKSRKGKAKIETVMHEFKEGELRSRTKKGPKVKSRKQALAIALNSARKTK